MKSSNRGGRRHAGGPRTDKVLVTPVLGGRRDGKALIERAEILYFFTRGSTGGRCPRVQADWAIAGALESERIHCRTRDMVAMVPLASIDQVVRAFDDLPLRVAANGVAVNLDRVAEVDESGRFGRLGFRVPGSRGELRMEWIVMSRTRAPEIIAAFTAGAGRRTDGGLRLDPGEAIDHAKVPDVRVERVRDLLDAFRLRVAEEARRLGEVRHAERIDPHEARAGRVDRHEVLAHHDDAGGAGGALDRSVPLHADDAVDDGELAHGKGGVDVEDAVLDAAPVEEVLRPAVDRSRDDPE